jgi:DNA replication and repair protein RecF
MDDAILREVSLYQFKNHQNLRIDSGNACLVLGPNGAGKSNLLESLYLLINGILPPGRTIEQCILDETASAFVRASILLPSGLAPEFTVSLNRSPAKIAFRIQGEVTTRAKYLQKHGLRAMLFTPIEMNMLYLGPALRRDFLDEILLLSHTEFLRVRRDYLAALRSRNALLKRIAEGKNPANDLDAWDMLFVQKARVYYTYRKKLIDTISSKLPEIAPKVRQGLELSFQYSTKVPIDQSEETIAQYMRAYLQSHREKDILIGHTCIGPHLDDFSFTIESSQARPQSSEYLSR